MFMDWNVFSEIFCHFILCHKVPLYMHLYFTAVIIMGLYLLSQSCCCVVIVCVVVSVCLVNYTSHEYLVSFLLFTFVFRSFVSPSN